MAHFGITSDGSRTFFLNGELDMATVPTPTYSAIVDAVGRGGPISMDLTEITFLDSTGLGAILKAASYFLPVASSSTVCTAGSAQSRG